MRACLFALAACWTSAPPAPLANVAAGPALPFVGVRDFAFARTRAAGYVVTVTDHGRMTIHVITTCSTSVIYDGPYRSLVVTTTDDEIFIAADHVRLIDNAGCTEAQPCVDDLTIPDWWPFTDANRPRCK